MTRSPPPTPCWRVGFIPVILAPRHVVRVVLQRPVGVDDDVGHAADVPRRCSTSIQAQSHDGGRQCRFAVVPGPHRANRCERELEVVTALAVPVAPRARGQRWPPPLRISVAQYVSKTDSGAPEAGHVLCGYAVAPLPPTVTEKSSSVQSFTGRTALPCPRSRPPKADVVADADQCMGRNDIATWSW